MKKIHIVRVLALLIVAGLIVTGAVAGAAEGPTPFASRVRGLIANLIPVSTPSAAGHVRATGERVTLHMAERQTPYLHLSSDAAAVPTEYATGTGLQELAGGARAHALASADFDEDGVPDLITGYESAGGGVVTLQRGNVDAIYPNSPEARERRARGEFTGAPFHSAAGTFVVPEAADFVGAGDFDADGHWDIVTARNGGDKLYWLRGDGHEGFAEPKIIFLPGAITCLVTGEMNRASGLTDVAVGIVTKDGARVLVFESPEGALRGAPETFPLPAAASALAFGQLDDDRTPDLAIASGNEVIIIHGRDRKLSSDAGQRTEVKPAEISRTVLDSPVLSVVVGDFVGDSRQELAALTADGSVRVFERQSETTKTTNDASATAFRASETMTLALDVAGAGTSPRRLLAAKVSALPKDDLLVFGGTNEVQIATTRDPDVFDKSGKLATTGSAPMSVAASLTSESEVAAVLPMRLNAGALRDLVIVTKNGVAPSVVQTQAAATFVVNIDGNTNDKTPGDGVCADDAGNCSFNAALQEVNAGQGGDTIQFNIPGAGIHTIQNSRTVDKTVTIDGTTQPGGRVEIVSPFSGINAVTLRFVGGNSVLRGVAIYGDNTLIGLSSSGNIVEGNYIGIRADGTKPIGTAVFGIWNVGSGGNNLIGGTNAQARNIISNCGQAVTLQNVGGNVVRGNYIGTNVAGTVALPNNNVINASFSDITIGGTTAGAGNLISGNGFGSAVSIVGSTAIIQGNLFGTTADGTQPIANGGIGIDLFPSISSEVVTIGGTTPAARNVIAANSTGIRLRKGSNELVQGNFIGTNSTGTGALPNASHGIEFFGVPGTFPSVTIGGTATGAGNLISGNAEDGIFVAGNFGGSDPIIQGNLIGTDVNGVVAIPNASNGIELFQSGAGTVIGGTSAAARNVISGNRLNGIFVGGGASSGLIEGNYIGLNRLGTGALGNTGNGVFFDNFNDGNTVGGTASGSSNTIAFNGGAGVATASRVLLVGGAGGAVQANSIHDNGGLGIDIYGDGVTKNTPGSGSNYPVITSVQTSDTGTTIQGTLQNGNYTAGITYTLQFFSNMNVDPSGYGEGETYIGKTTITTDGTTSPHPFSLTVTPAVPPGRFITAVASGRDQFNTPGFEYLSEFSFAAKVTGNTTPQNTPLRVIAITPQVGGDNGSATATIIGEGISQGATVVLRRAGQPDIIGENAVVSADGSSMTARFNLRGRALGLWDVVVTNADGTTAVLAGGYTVEAGRGALMWTDILGRSRIRINSEARFTVVFGNRGNTDAYMVPVWIAGIPKNATVTLGFTLGKVPIPDVQGAVDPNQISPLIATATEQLLPVIIPVIRPGKVGTLQFTIKVPPGAPEFTLRSWSSPALVKSITQSSPALVKSITQAGASNRDGSFGGLNPSGNDNIVTSDEGIECLAAIFNAALSCALNVIPGSNCLKSIGNYAANTLTLNTGGDDALGWSQFAGGALQTVVACLTSLNPGINGYLSLVSCAASAYSAINTCRDGVERKYPVRPVASRDPNDKVGSQGSGVQQYVTGQEPFRYAIYFENVATATAPAQEVVITDQLDASKFDLKSFQLGAISFGKDLVVAPPPGLSEWTTDIDLRPGKNLIVRVIAALDKTTALATWRFISLDPATKQPTADALAGFLPPNQNAPEGDGAVVFTVEAKPGQPTGTELRNMARVVFDTNTPINTPEWLNTIDNSKPVSQVAALTATQDTVSFPVNWSGTDTGAGISVYTIYVSDNGGPFTIWINNTTATTAVFTGQPGRTYGFYSIATDGAGNREDAPATADATTTISNTAPTPTPTPTPTVNLPPVASCKNIEVAAGSSCTATINPSDVNAGSSDPDPGDSITLSLDSTGPFGLGPHAVTLTVTDNHGASSSCSATVTVKDNTPPTIAAPPNVNATTGPGATGCGAIISDTTLGAAIAGDNCSGVAVSRSGVPAGNFFPVGTTAITYTAADASGNTRTATQIVTVVDDTPPKITCPSPITGEFTSEAGAAVAVPTPAVTDNCGVTVSGVRSDGQPLTALYPIGTTTINWTATDAAGNKASCSETVTVLGALGTLQDVLSGLTSLRASLTSRSGREELGDAIEELTDAVNPKLWIDQNHVQCEGARVFEETKEAVHELRELMRKKKTRIDNAVLQGFINRIVRADRLLAVFAINDAIAADGNAKDIAKARDLVAEGDRDIAAGRYESIGDYRQAWRQVTKSKCESED